MKKKLLLTATALTLLLTSCGQPVASPTPVPPTPTPIPLTPTAAPTEVRAGAYWPTTGWRTSTPEEQGMDSTKLDQMMELIDELDLAIDSVVVVRNGYIVLEEYPGRYGPQHKHFLTSATAPLIEFTRKFPNLRAASMPGVTKGMEQTALAADYSEVARKSHILAARLDQAVGAEVEFSTGHQMYFDLRYRKAEADDGQLHADKKGVRVIKLPSGEAYIAPYEGESAGQPSQTEGTIPVMYDDELVLLKVQENRIVEVIGDSPEAAQIRGFIAVDKARRNVAELGLGCNDKAVISGNVLEDEKVLGMHWALGRSDHIGGTVGVSDFSDPAYVVHWDIVYPLGGPIEIASLVLEYEDGTSEEIIRDGQYLSSIR